MKEGTGKRDSDVPKTLQEELWKDNHTPRIQIAFMSGMGNLVQFVFPLLLAAYC